jgi:alkanesulfonate monooxygenase SsuD/methylene tetrahydromethanopterin reductase-like flavin-dependent oxidoreductase (luciferase family)
MKVGLFDHVERSDRPLATEFDERLKFAVAAEEAGIYCLHVAEHHGTPLNMVPVPGVYLAARCRARPRACGSGRWFISCRSIRRSA